MFNVILLIPLILFGIRTSFTDIKYGKIKNYDVITAIIIGILINLPRFGLMFIGNVIIMFLLSFGLYMIGLLSPGDAKLLIAYSSLVPMDVYIYGVSKTFPSLSLIANIFIPAALIVVGTSLKTFNLKIFLSVVKERFRPRNIINLMIIIFGLFYMLNYGLSLLGINLGRFGNIFVFIIVIQFLNYLRIPLNKIAYAGAIVRIFIQWKELSSIQFYLNFLENFLYFQIIILMVMYFTNFSLSTAVKIEDLKPGMRLSQILKKTKSGYITTDVLIFNIFSLIRTGLKSIHGIHVLDKKTIDELKRLKREGKLKFNYLKITQTFPFAPFAFLGVILTVILKGSLSFYLITVKSYLGAYWQIFIYLIRQKLIKLGVYS